MAVHEGHRARKKEQFRSHGLDAFADHEVLELLLYYAVPRQDTNPIAHRLMEKFGSLEAVFSAGCAELKSVEGVGENAATLLSLFYPLFAASARLPVRTRSFSAMRSRRGAIFSTFFSASGRKSFTPPVSMQRAACWRAI